MASVSGVRPGFIFGAPPSAIGRFGPGTAFAARPLVTGVPEKAAAPAPTLADVRQGVRTLGDAVDAALASLVRRAPMLPGSQPSLAVARGQVSSLGAASTLFATQQVNTQTSTVRASGEALGLDTTTAEAPSRLASTAAIGLDVTTAEAASTLASSSVLGLDVSTAEAVSRLTSTAEANTASTSYDVVEATFSAGTSRGTLSGVFAGTGAAKNATSLTLEITSPSGTIGDIPTLVSVKVRANGSANLGTYSALLTAGQALSLGADVGLSIAFGAGSITSGATTTFGVSATTPTHVDPNAAFNAGPNERPRFDAGRTVTAGAFTVNGTSVSVLAGDSINTVLARINSTVAGVVASFSGDRVTIESAAASEDAITLANDTSGFLTALNLTGATTVTGNVRDDRQVFSKTSQFAGVGTGTFTVNGVTIAVNHQADTLESLIARINAAGAGVTAAYDSATDKIRLTTTGSSEDDIVVAGDSSGFLAAGHLSTNNTVRGNVHDDVQALAGVAAFAGVTAGSFTINGVAIAVDPAVDTLQSLIATINASAAGVTASYDGGTDTLTLTSSTNSEDDIVVGNDTTGWLTAVNLSGAATVRGTVDDDRQALATVARFAAVTDGSFVVNGRTITVSAATDTLTTVLARVNAAGAGVTATYDAVADTVVFTPDTPGATLVIDQDTSGFLAAAAIGSGARGTRVNTTGVFNGTGANAPLFDPAHTVGAGSFTVNGVTISVAATDTLETVLARITASSAGVTATFDSVGETVRLTAKRAGATPITVGNDTSGFLAAVKLDGTAASTPGTSTLDVALAGAGPFAGVTGGTLTFNGRSVTIDPAADTLAGIVTSIDALDGISATLDAASGRVTITTERRGTHLDVADDSGLLAALGIGTGEIRGRVGTPPSRRVSPDTVRAVTTVVGRVNALLDTLDRADGLAPRVRADLVNAVRTAAAASGLTLSTVDGRERLVIDTGKLETLLADDPRVLDAFLAGKQGLPDGLSTALATPEAAPPEPAPQPAAIDKPLMPAALLRDAAMTMQLRTLQLLDALAMPAPRRLDMLA